MALSQNDRITLSKKVTLIPVQDATADQIKDILEEGKQKAEDEDNANKGLLDSKTALVNPYQKELSKYDSNDRTELVEQDIIDGAEKKFQNFFFANDPQTPLPSSPDGVWKNFAPSGYSKAIGKNYLEVFPGTVVKEQDKIDAVNSAISSVEAITDNIRSSGQECNEDDTGTCSLPAYTDQISCETATPTPGIWTPNGGLDIYSPNAAVSSALSALQTAINDWKSFVNSTKTLIQAENVADTNAGRQTQNNTAISDIDNLVSVVDAWDALQDFDTSTTLPTGSGGAGCALFDAMVPGDFDPSKLRSIELQEIKDEITARQSFISTRISEITTNLGSISQGADGRITSASGFYGDRFRLLDVRLNLMAGSLNKLKAIENGQKAQDEQKASNENANVSYSSAIKVSLFRAPASGGPIIHLKDASDFNPGDSVFVMADSQEEISTSIISKDGDAVTLADSIPKKYRENDGARLYKDA